VDKLLQDRLTMALWDHFKVVNMQLKLFFTHWKCYKKISLTRITSHTLNLFPLNSDLFCTLLCSHICATEKTNKLCHEAQTLLRLYLMSPVSEINVYDSIKLCHFLKLLSVSKSLSQIIRGITNI
jgi:hypothetical protein